MIKLAVFEGSKKSVFKDRQELSGSLLEQLEEAFDYIDRYNRTHAKFSGLNRLDMRDYPPEAIREALLNAVPQLCRSKGSIVRSDVETALSVSQSTAILLLRE